MPADLPQMPATGVFRPTKGRPTKYNDRIAKQICLYVAQGMSLRKVSHQPGMPSWSQLKIWLIEHPTLRQTIAALRWINSTELGSEALECFDDVNPASEDFNNRLALARAKSAAMLAAARLLDLRTLPRQIQENEDDFQ